MHYPHLSCWERQGEGVDDGAQRSEARLDGLDVRRREQMQPGQEQTRTDVGLEQQPEVVELVLPAGAGVPGGVSLQQGGRRRFRGGGVRAGGVPAGGGAGWWGLALVWAWGGRSAPRRPSAPPPTPTSALAPQPPPPP